MSIQPVFLMSDIFPFSAILDFLRDILMQAWLCLAVVLRPIVGDTIVDAFPFIMGGTLVTVGSVALALGMGLVLGVPMAVLQVYGNALARRLVGLYVWFFRGVPILVLLFLSQGLFLSMGWILEPFLLSCLVMGCISTAYQSQIFRGAIESLPQGQLKAARALGMRDMTAITCIILPQALRLSIPGWANEFSILLKDSAVCYLLGTMETARAWSCLTATGIASSAESQGGKTRTSAPKFRFSTGQVAKWLGGRRGQADLEICENGTNIHMCY